MFILGTKIDNITLSQGLEKAESFLRDGKQHYIVTPNPEIVLQAKRDVSYRAILNKADLSIPDGVGLIWASKVLYGKRFLKGRIAGVDFMYEFLRYVGGSTPALPAGRPHIKVLLLGGRNGVAKKAAGNLKKNFQNVKFYALEDIDNARKDFLINEIYKPDCVFVGLGAPRQEKWIYDNISKYPTVKIAMGVGGSFDFISGRVRRAPIIFRNIGIEWLWRLVMQPWRAGRIFNAVIFFPLAVLRERAKF